MTGEGEEGREGRHGEGEKKGEGKGQKSHPMVIFKSRHL